jgi:hypothetical protein
MRQIRKLTSREMLDNPYYQVLRFNFGRPASAAKAAVEWYEAFRARMGDDEPEEKEKENA